MSFFCSEPSNNFQLQSKSQVLTMPASSPFFTSFPLILWFILLQLLSQCPCLPQLSPSRLCTSPQINAWLTLEFPSSLDPNDTFSVRPSVQNYKKLHQPPPSQFCWFCTNHYLPFSLFLFSLPSSHPELKLHKDRDFCVFVTPSTL